MKLSQPEYYDTEFKNEDFSDIEIRGKSFFNCTFIHCSFKESIIGCCLFDSIRFEGCNFSLSKVPSTAFKECEFSGCNLKAVNWSEAKWPSIAVSSQVNFYQSDLSHSTFMAVCLKEAIFHECKLHSTDFREADLTEGQLTRCEMSGALFNNTELAGASLVGSIDYDIDFFANNIKGAGFSLPEAMSLLNCLDIVLTE